MMSPSIVVIFQLSCLIGGKNGLMNGNQTEGQQTDLGRLWNFLVKIHRSSSAAHF